MLQQLVEQALFTMQYCVTLHHTIASQPVKYLQVLRHIYLHATIILSLCIMNSVFHTHTVGVSNKHIHLTQTTKQL
jgi:hypothetical protein